MNDVSLHYSKVGYDIGKKITVLLSTGAHKNPIWMSLTTNYTHNHVPSVVYSSPPTLYGEVWDRVWYSFDFSKVDRAGTYGIVVEFDDGENIQNDPNMPLDIGDNLLWHRSWYSVSLEQLDVRRSTAYSPEGGFRDCGSPLQEVSSHLVMLDSLCDLLCCDMTSQRYQDKIISHIICGADYVCKCRDKAEELGLGKGAVVHEIRENLNVSSGNCARLAVVFSRIYTLINNTNPKKAEIYLDAAIATFDWIVKNGPIVYTDDTDNLRITHGATGEYKTPPNQFMTRDVLSLCEAALCFTEIGRVEYRQTAYHFAKIALGRQVARDNSEGDFYGHFYSYDGVDFTEKANLHCGAWSVPYKNYNQGAHMPYWILPLIKIAKDKSAGISIECDRAVRNFCYGFLLPTTAKTPFGIIPAGYYKGQGLCFFSGWYHGHSKIYGFITKLAIILGEYLSDKRLLDLATDNIQWITGLNSGLKEQSSSSYTSKSLIVGVGSSYHTDWNNLRGTVINGYDANSQFSIHPVEIEKDLPSNLDDEGGIHHSSGFLSGLCYYTSL